MLPVVSLFDKEYCFPELYRASFVCFKSLPSSIPQENDSLKSFRLPLLGAKAAGWRKSLPTGA